MWGGGARVRDGGLLVSCCTAGSACMQTELAVFVGVGSATVVQFKGPWSLLGLTFDCAGA
eukprot:12689878-Prorocentrum_lima.AAC.1